MKSKKGIDRFFYFFIFIFMCINKIYFLKIKIKYQQHIKINSYFLTTMKI